MSKTSTFPSPAISIQTLPCHYRFQFAHELHRLNCPIFSPSTPVQHSASTPKSPRDHAVLEKYLKHPGAPPENSQKYFQTAMLNASNSLHRCCSLQSSSGPPELRKTRRLHGLQLPLHPLQVGGWLVLVLLSSGGFVSVIPHLSAPLRTPFTLTLGAILAVHAFTHVFALVLDPSDPQVRKQPTNNVVPEFDRTKHLHVIENGRCHLCNITTTSKRTKHCSVCNKCVKKFDHHCMWLNSCVGERNYKFFIVCVVSAIFGSVILVGLSFGEVLVTIERHFNGVNMTMENITMPIVSIQPIQSTSTLIIISLVGVLSAIAAALLIHLCIFHGYIAYLGLTTYEYVRNKREQRALMQEDHSKMSHSSISNYHFCKDLKSGEEPPKVSDTSQVYICSTHTTQSDSTPGRNKEKRNFHLYFTYETPADATSFELSQTASGEQRPEDFTESVKGAELKPLTPSPVSCCFSIMHRSWTDRKKKKGSSHRNEEDKVVTRCTPVRRIQTFLRSRLRKNARQRTLDSTRGRKNRIGPIIGSSGPNAEEAKNGPQIEEKGSPIESIAGNIQRESPEVSNVSLEVAVRPIKLPPLNLPSTDDIIHENSVFTLPVMKRSQQLRIRRPSFHRRPRFKMSPHVTQSAQLSPIPESEFSKPASPRSPPKLKHFTFPPTSTD
ncbi:uncharacterized protein LOC135159979 isoform X1 [Diachasmimorpha longicaudata]|uniref:uncharacterized protein LOC135159979 isoform X1 n=1 Tax=Diachasmimorpha longicaudata TaxID=58733 RepID=UPI0030B8B5DA